MGFNEFGQSIVAIILFGVVMLVAFGGFQNQSLYSDRLPNGLTGPNDFNNSNTGIVITNTSTPFAIPTGANPSQDNNPFLNLIFEDLGNYYNSFTKAVGGLLDALNFIGLPPQIIYAITAPVSWLIGLFLIYFIATLSLGIFRGVQT